jgi:hypothetical protein
MVLNRVVSIKYCLTAPFDTKSACISQASRFMVDMDHRIILTNRHVVTEGPFWGYAVFCNHDQVRPETPCQQTNHANYAVQYAPSLSRSSP